MNKIPDNSTILPYLQEKFSILCGAGISFESGIPVVWPFVDFLLKELGINQENHRDEIHSKWQFEALMEKITMALTDHNILTIFDNKANSLLPNKTHCWIANQVSNGCVQNIYTTNFDTFIEEACYDLCHKKTLKSLYHPANDHPHSIDKINTESSPLLIKLHGCISDPESIAVTMKSITAEHNSPSRNKALDYLFDTKSSELLLIIGYSFSDEFDITPRIQEYEISSKKIYYICHDKNCDTPEIRPLVEVENIKGETGFFNPLKNIASPNSLWIRGNASHLLGIFTTSSSNSEKWTYTLKEILDLVPIEQKKLAAAWLYMDLGKLNEAEIHFNNILETKKSSLIVAKAYLYLAQISKTRRDYKLGLKYLNQAQEDYKEDLFSTQIHVTRSRIMSDMGDYQDARKELQCAHSICEDIGDSLAMAEVKGHIGIIENKLSNNRKSTLYLQEAYDYFKFNGYVEGYIVASIYLAENQQKFGFIDRAKEIYKEADALASKYGKSLLLEDIRVSHANLLQEIGEHGQALADYQKAQEKFLKIGDPGRIASTENNIGKLLLTIGRTGEAESSFLKAIKACKHFDDLEMIAHCHNNLGAIYLEQDTPSKALRYFKKAQTYFTKEEIKPDIIFNYINQALSHEHENLNNIEQCFECFELAFEWSRKTDDPNLMANCLFYKADTLRTLNMHEEALGLYDRAKTFATANDLNLKIYYSSAKSLHQLNLIPEADEHFKEAIELAHNSHIELPNIYADYAINLAEQENMIEAQQAAYLAIKEAEKTSNDLAQSIRDDLEFLLED